MHKLADPSPGWSDLPTDLLVSILDRLELPEILAVAAVCAPWRSAVTIIGVPASPRCTPWLMFWDELGYDPIMDSNFLNLCDKKVYHVSFPQGRSLYCCGSSHGWLIAADELSNLLLYNPFTRAKIPLPPITDFECVKAVHDNEGHIVGYICGGVERPDNTCCLGTCFYLKTALSCDPSQGGNYTAMLIHGNGDWLSFSRAGEGCWRLASTLTEESEDTYADCVYHDGRFYTLTLQGVLEAWDLDGQHVPKSEVIIGKRDRRRFVIIAKYLVPTPWGDLLQVWAMRDKKGNRKHTKSFAVQIYKIDLEERKLVRMALETALGEHAVFLGQNHSACLPTKDFPRLRPNCIYFTTSSLMHPDSFEFHHGWKGGGIYDLKNLTLRRAFGGRRYPNDSLTEMIWITPGRR